MIKFYSPSTYGFYSDRIHKDIPADAIEISDDDYRNLITGHLKGQEIIVSGDTVSLKDPSPEKFRKEAMVSLEQALHRYLFNDHGYPLPTQTTIHAICNDPATPEPIKKQARSVVTWINTCVLPHYYAIKAEITGSKTPASVEFDFAAACDSAAPGVKLVDLII